MMYPAFHAVSIIFNTPLTYLVPSCLPGSLPFLNGVTSPIGRQGETCVLSGWRPCDRREAVRQRAEHSESMEVEEFLSGRIFHLVSFRLEDLGWGVWVLCLSFFLSLPSSSLFLPNLRVLCGCVPCNFVGVVVVVVEVDCGSSGARNHPVLIRYQ